MKTKCVIIDDEPLAIEVIESYINKMNDLELTGKFTNPIIAFEKIRSDTPDLIFLDIEMPELSGIDFIRTLANPPAIIFTTAYREYALEGFELEALDYLLKPVSFERFLRAINKYYKIYSSPVQTKITEQLPGPEQEYIYIKENKKAVKVFLRDILYLESLKDYVKVVCKECKIITKSTMNHFGEILPEEKFLRIHRSTIIARSAIKTVSHSMIETGNRQFTIGRNYKNEVLKALKLSNSGF